MTDRESIRLLPPVNSAYRCLDLPVPIASQAWPDGTKPLVSFCCFAYNHAQYLRECLDSFLTQETNFPVEIIVHDDASTDGTREILEEYEAKYKNLFRNIYQETNQMSLGGDINTLLFSKARGHYIALCEGDDYWTDPQKISQQVSYMRDNPDCAACFHDAVYCDYQGKTIKNSFYQGTVRKYDQRECLAGLLSQYPTCSLLFVRAAACVMPPWFLRRPSDLFLELVITRFGKMGYLPIKASAYRAHNQGIWSRLNVKKQALELIRRFQLLLEEPEFAQIYKNELNTKIDEFSGMLCLQSDLNEVNQKLEEASQRLRIIEKQNRQMLSSLSWKMTRFLRLGLSCLKRLVGSRR